MDQEVDVMARRVSILGSTGSVGLTALNLIRENKSAFSVVALAAGGSDIRSLARQVVEFKPKIVAVSRSAMRQDLSNAIADALREANVSSQDWDAPLILGGEEGVEQAAVEPADVVLNAITGAAGLRATVAVLSTDNILALANKESLILGGEVVKGMASDGQIVPVDSEHSAILQALRVGSYRDVDQLILTANGGPFRGWTREELATVTLADALKHPKWSMGPDITINSATMVNKGLEVIEANLLFDIPFSNIQVMIHPQSVIHSMVEYSDGSTVPLASVPDMRLPVSLGLYWPARYPNACQKLDWSSNHVWELFHLSGHGAVAINLAKQVGEAGGSAPGVFNAANEACLSAFRKEEIPFLAIVDTVQAVVEEHSAFNSRDSSLDAFLEADQWARRKAREILKARY